ncbi:tetratricopeptide repeat protein [Rubrivirga sp.]|uniref:tetratricopeptide repeat protein n=1 Tax=Rubrivirga sp. TaxID=1885344 RepID=UPI003C739533
MRPSRLALFVLAFGALAACSAPSTGVGSGGSNGMDEPFVPDDPTAYGPGDYCSDTYVLLQPTIRSNFSLGSEYYRNGDYCAAYPYIKNILETEPLFTGEDPDDRNYLRMASIYEAFAAEVDSTNLDERVAYLDSALTTRRMGVEALEANGIEYDVFLRDLREGFFYFQNAAFYDDAEERKFQAFNRALEAQPDSLEDWYITQLFTGSADVYGDEIPNPDRGAFIRRLAEAADDPALKANYVAFADYVETEPSVQDQVAGSDEAVQALLNDLEAGTLTGTRVFTLLATAQQQPERLEALGADPGAIISALVVLPEIESQVDNPRTLYALSVRARRSGDTARANDLFSRAIANAESNAQRADFYYSAGQYDRALQVFPSHGPSLYRRAGLIGQSVGRPSGLRGRFAYWCLADIYRNVAAQTSGNIAAQARRAAAQYERAGPTREQYFLEGFQPGQSVSSSLGAYGSCTTRVR